jgi:hypothetical protein
MAEKPIHQEIAEAIIKKVTPAARKRLKLTPKGSYTIVADESGWVARITAKVAEFNKKRVEPKALTEAGMTEAGKDDFHKVHLAAAALSPATVRDGGGEEVGVEVVSGPGVPELAKAVGVAAKPVKAS